MGPDEQIIAGKYRLEESLGEGGMGRVDAAVNIYSGQRVALKRLSFARVPPQGRGEGPLSPPEMPAPERRALMERLLKESKALAQLDHPYIVRLLDCGPTGPIETGDIYIAMELVEGDSLRALIRGAAKQGKVLNVELVLKVAAEVAEAMDFAHIKKVYHRDLKPENIIVARAGQAKVVDFGLAKMSATGPLTLPGDADHQSNPANVVGTPRYMSPEQVRGLEVDARTDIYALGVTIYEAVSGRTPYDAHEDGSATVTELMGHHVFAEPTPVRVHVPNCPERVSHIINRCLAKRPEDRYPHMGSLARDIRAVLEELAPQVDAARGGAARIPDALPGVEPERAVRDEPAPREAQMTEPMPQHFRPAALLPFEPGAAAPVPREVRVTEPMPEPPGAPRPVLPFKGAAIPPPSTSPPGAVTLVPPCDAVPPAAEPDEEVPSRSAIPPPPSTPPSALVVALHESTPSRSAIPPLSSTPIALAFVEAQGGVAVPPPANPDDEVTLKRSGLPLALVAPPPQSPPADSLADAPGAPVVPPTPDGEAPAPTSTAAPVGSDEDSAPHGTLGSRESGDGGLQSGPGFAFESMLSGAQKESAMQDRLPQTSMPPAKPRRPRLYAYAAPLFVGLSLAVFGMLAIMKVHDAAGGDREALLAERSRVNAPTSASAPPASASASATGGPSAPAPPPIEVAASKTPVAAASTIIEANAARPAVRPQRPTPIGTPLAAERPRAPVAPTNSAPTVTVPPPSAPPPAPSVAPHRVFGSEQ